jgi:hypothetical protein
MHLRLRHNSSPTVSAPTFLVEPGRERITVSVSNASVLPLVPPTIRLAAVEANYEPSMNLVIDCRRCLPPPSVADVRILAETLSDSTAVQGPVAVLVTGGVAAIRYRLDRTLTSWTACQVQVFDNEASLESWLSQSPSLL